MWNVALFYPCSVVEFYGEPKTTYFLTRLVFGEEKKKMPTERKSENGIKVAHFGLSIEVY